MLQRGDEPSATQKRDGSEDSKAAIDESPRDRNATDMACDESEWNHSSASDQTKRDDPFVADRIAVRAYEQNGEHKVGKSKPVRSIRQERKARICFRESAMHEHDPGQQMSGFSDSLHGRGLEDRQRPMQLGL